MKNSNLMFHEKFILTEQKASARLATFTRLA